MDSRGKVRGIRGGGLAGKEEVSTMKSTPALQ